MNVVTHMLHQREMSVGRLARLSKVGRTQLNLMLSGKRSGRNSWKHVDPFLHPVERDVLRRTTRYSEWEKGRPPVFHVEQHNDTSPISRAGVTDEQEP